ncbi:5-methylcytosine rRNA methyltransferase nsun4, partial [Blomia tropicalis]
YKKYGDANDATELALQHYDNFYLKVYGNKWPSIRLGLLSPNKYAAMVNYFADSSEATQIKLRQEGAYDLAYVYEKNLKRILRFLEKKKYIGSFKSLSDNKNLNEVAPNILSSNVTSDSEFEDIGAFFTDSDASSSGTFINAAQLDLELNDFIPAQELNIQEEIIDDREYFEFYEMDSDVPNISFKEQNVLNYPTMLSLFTFPRNDFSNYPSPRLDKSNLFNYYLFDLASALPPIVLDVSDGDYVADFCAAPGGKSLLLYLTLKDARFFFNDMSKSRFGRLQNVFNSFIPKSIQQKSITFSNCDAIKLNMHDTFDKILVDAPCTNDRHSLYNGENNIFSKNRINERVQLPNRQLNLLLSAMRSIKRNGTIVYSTCSLSPIQNDGVVHMALKQMAFDSTRTFSVVHLKEAMRPLR